MLGAIASVVSALPKLKDALAPYLPYIFVPRSESGEVWIYIVSNLCTSAALLAMVLVLFQVMRKKTDYRLRGASILAGSFFGLRATTQLLSNWTTLHPAYRIRWEVTALVSVLAVATAVALVWLLPLLHRIPSITDLENEIQERRRAEEEAIAKEERFRAFVESVEDYAIYMIDPKGVVLSWNHGAERMKGYKAEEIVGQCFSRFYTAEDRANGNPQRALRMAAETGRFEGEGWRVRKDGTRFLANVVMRAMRDSKGVLRGFSKVTRDLTASREMEARHQLVLEAVPSAIVILNRAGRIEYGNAHAEFLFEWTRAEMAGQPVELLMPGRCREAQGAYLRTLVDGAAHPSPQAPEEFLGLRKGGGEFPLEFSVSRLHTKAGGELLLAFQDLTERKKAADLLAKKVMELRHSNEELEQFAHVASHDLQEPLRMVASYVQLLSRRYRGRLDADADEFIDFAVDGTQRMKRLIEDLLRYSRLGRRMAATRNFPSEQAVREAMHNLKAAIEESHAEITWEPLPEVTAVELQLVQVFQNLIGNAIKYRGDRAPRVHIAAKRGEMEWVFSVADNGIGIEPAYFERIFAIFQRLHGGGEYEGTGVGLAICKRILMQQGGRIWVESQDGAGSTFYFTLPFP
jgi:PAS domain S-box-containing protein